MLAAQWLAEYQPGWLKSDAVVGITLAAYAIPVSPGLCGARRGADLGDLFESVADAVESFEAEKP